MQGEIEKTSGRYIIGRVNQILMCLNYMHFVAYELRIVSLFGQDELYIIFS